MIVGAHSIIYSAYPEADRTFLRDVLKLTHVDVGGGWLIFGLPPAEVAVHPSNRNDVHEFYLICDDVEALVTQMRTRGIGCAPVTDQRWGLLTHISLPGGGKLGVYEPRHARPKVIKVRAAKAATKSSAKRASRRKSALGIGQFATAVPPNP